MEEREQIIDTGNPASQPTQPTGNFTISPSEFAELIGYRVLVPQLLRQIDALRDSIQVPSYFNGQDSIAVPSSNQNTSEQQPERDSKPQSKNYPTGQTTDYNSRLS